MRFVALSISLLCGALSLLFFSFANSAAKPRTLEVQTIGPSLAVATGITATASSTVTLPINFRRGGLSVAGMAFSLDIDPTCLRYVDKKFTLPPQQSGSISYDANDSAGELDVVIADYSPPFAVIPDTDGVIKLIFEIVCAPQLGGTITTPVTFSASPPASFSDGQGQALSGNTANGVIEIIRPIMPPSPTPTTTPSPTPTPMPKLAANKIASHSSATIGDKIEYSYRISNTGNISLSVVANDDKLGKIALWAMPGGTAMLPAPFLAPGRSAAGAQPYLVHRCDAQGLLVNTLTVTGTASQQITTTAQVSASVFISNPVLSPLAAKANTIYIGCAIRLIIPPGQVPQADEFQMVIILGPPPQNLILEQVQELYPYQNLHSIADKTNQLLVEACENNTPCNSIKRIIFYNGVPFSIDLIKQFERVTDAYLPLIAKN